jgi:quercetin dioxygenase-like cupin family protein
MSIPHAEHGQVIDLSTFHTESAALVKTGAFEVIRIVVGAGKSLPSHKVEGPITVQCLSGRCTFFVDDQPRELSPGAWLYLSGGTQHAVKAAETSVLLVTILFAKE